MQVVTSRMRHISNVNKDSPVRIVGLCTSLANAKDLGEWIGATAHGLFNFPPGAPQTATSQQAVPWIIVASRMAVYLPDSICSLCGCSFLPS